jgi:signal transduction histidine kinase
VSAIRRLFRSLTFRLALIYLALFTISVALLLGTAWWMTVLHPLEDVEESLLREADALGDIYIVDGPAALEAALARRAATVSDRKAFHAYVAIDGRVVANLPTWPAQPRSGWARFEADLYVDGDEEDHEALVHEQNFRDGARLIVGRDIEDIDEREEVIEQLILWSGIAVLILGLAGGVVMSLAVGRRIEAVNATARKVIAGDLSGRVPTRGSGDDFDRLGDTLNLMLARIEALVEAVSRVSDSIAHELRTPLARLQADLDELGAAGDAGERARLIEAAGAEAARLQATFDSLLRIARLETGRHAIERRPVDLAKLLADAAELYAPEADDQRKTLDVAIAPGLATRGDPNLLFQAVTNLLDNALKHTPPGSRIRLTGARADGVLIEVADDGPGLPADQRGRAIERFYRAPGSEGRPGIGLGLSVVDAVARAHGARLELADNDPGLAVRLHLPSGG